MPKNKEIENQIVFDPSLSDHEPISLDLMTALFKSTIKENSQLRATIERINKKESKLRDKLATKIYATLITLTNAEVAAEDAYKAADTFLRIRENGKSYEEDLLELFKKTAMQVPNDQDLGKTIREYLAKRQNGL